MDINISKISKLHFRNFNGNNILTKGILAKVGDVEEGTMKNGEKYGKFLLSQGRSAVYAFAFGETYELCKKELQTDKFLKFPSDTFSCKSKYLKRNSNSTCKYDMTFLRRSRFVEGIRSRGVTSNDVDCDTSSLRKVSQFLRTSQTFTRKLKAIKLNCGEVYRYWGCKTCNFSIPRQHTDGLYYCKGLCNNKLSRRRKIGVPTERNICIVIHNVKLSDDTNNDAIGSVVIFNSVSESLLQKRGGDFDTDNEARKAWTHLITNNCFDITLKRNKKKKESKYPPAVFLHSVDNVIAVSSSTCTKSEPEPLLEYSCDETGDRSGGKKKKILPKFPKFEMKLQYRTEPSRNFVTKYRNTSKPSGLVLLINNLNFPYREKEEDKRRLGSEGDISLLQRAFCVMGYEIYGNKCYIDMKTKAELSALLNNFRTELCARDVDSFFIVISSHGRNNEIELPEDDKMVCVVEEIMIPFSDKFLPQYQGRPKVFMPITCQNFGSTALGKSLEFLDNKLFDMLVCCPSFPGYSQLRINGSRNGSLFVHCLADNLMKYATSWHLLEILDKVQSDMRKQIEERGLDITVSHYLASTFGDFALVRTEKLEEDPFQYMDIDCV